MKYLPAGRQVRWSEFRENITSVEGGISMVISKSMKIYFELIILPQVELPRT